MAKHCKVKESLSSRKKDVHFHARCVVFTGGLLVGFYGLVRDKISERIETQARSAGRWESPSSTSTVCGDVNSSGR
jgi:hypothetical protein